MTTASACCSGSAAISHEPAKGSAIRTTITTTTRTISVRKNLATKSSGNRCRRVRSNECNATAHAVHQPELLPQLPCARRSARSPSAMRWKNEAIEQLAPRTSQHRRERALRFVVAEFGEERSGVAQHRVKDMACLPLMCEHSGARDEVRLSVPNLPEVDEANQWTDEVFQADRDRLVYEGIDVRQSQNLSARCGQRRCAIPHPVVINAVTRLLHKAVMHFDGDRPDAEHRLVMRSRTRRRAGGIFALQPPLGQRSEEH